jgi:hypothetical protein
MSYGVHEGACIQPKHAAAKTFKKKKKIVSRVLTFIYHSSTNFPDLFFLKHI